MPAFRAPRGVFNEGRGDDARSSFEAVLSSGLMMGLRDPMGWRLDPVSEASAQNKCAASVLGADTWRNPDGRRVLALPI